MSIGPGPTPLPLGRDTARTIRAFDRIAATVAPAPTLFRGPVPRRSPRLDRFRFARHRGQLIGCCVGESGSAMGETAVQTPDPLTPESKPTGLAVSFSPLWVYWVARRETAKYDRSIYRGEGAIVSDALKAVQAEGLVDFAAWPATEATYRAYRDDRPHPGINGAARRKVIGDVRRLVDPEQVLEYLAGGFSVWIGVPWRGGFETRAAADGRHRFGWNQPAAGGHAVELLAYDLDANEVAVGNSWMNAGWGDRERGVGWCPWSHLARDLSAVALRSGQSEAVVFTEVEGDWTPRAEPLDWRSIL